LNEHLVKHEPFFHRQGVFVGRATNDGIEISLRYGSRSDDGPLFTGRINANRKRIEGRYWLRGFTVLALAGPLLFIAVVVVPEIVHSLRITGFTSAAFINTLVFVGGAPVYTWFVLWADWLVGFERRTAIAELLRAAAGA
jgi:hypothetical protein